MMKALEYWRETLVENAALRDALAQLVGWVEECGSAHEGREYALTEARAALKGLRLVSTDGESSHKEKD
jgi:hypothetical protein